MAQGGLDEPSGADVCRSGLTLRQLIQRTDSPGNLQIVTATTAEVAAIAAHRHHLCSGSKMPDGFIFDGPDVDGRENTVAEIVKCAMTINMRLAETTLAMCQFTAP
ncbi:MAG: hypothetical protein L3J84_06475 [Gammaproteobacteria bacterium]|nr:hypothetical protein [Gammaproteobacteria bacterium]